MTQKRKIWLLILAAVLLVAAVAVLVTQPWKQANSNDILSEEAIRKYNAAITTAARKAGTIGAQDFILIDTISQESSGHTDITIRVYRLPEGKSPADYAHLQVSDVPADFAPEHIANGTARLLKGSLDSIVVSVTFIR